MFMHAIKHILRKQQKLMHAVGLDTSQSKPITYNLQSTRLYIGSKMRLLCGLCTYKMYDKMCTYASMYLPFVHH